MEFLLVDPFLFQEWIAPNRLLQLALRPRTDRHRKTKVGENLRLDLAGQRRGRKLPPAEDHISTLNVRLNLVESQTLERLPQQVHLYPLVPANVDSAQQGDVGRHDAKD